MAEDEPQVVHLDPFNLPPATPAGNVYPNLIDSTQHARNNFQPRKRVWTRTISAQENEACLKRTLQKYWGYDSFRGPQLDICLSVMAGCDVLVVAPTGIGKSVCFQVPAVTVEYGITIVVSPLLALMKDQVAGLNEKGIKAAMLYEKTDEATKKYVGKQLSMGHPELRLLYVTPETLFTSRCGGYLRAAYKQRQLARLVIDEAHVIEEWGLTFRSAYRDLGKFREEFRDIPVTAVTASATEDVREDIVDILKINRGDLAQWVQPFNRKNLFYEVRYYNDEQRKYKVDNLAQFIKTFSVKIADRNEKNDIDYKCISGLVYCRARMACQDIASSLRDRGINARAYHAQLKEAERDDVLEQWKAGNIDCIVATIAFGMGVDAPHVRYVVHYDMPKSFEGYYQETGRAGRDGHVSRCVLYYSREDAANLRGLIEKEAKKEEDKRRSKKTADAAVVVDEAELGRAKIRCVNSFKLMQQYAEAFKTCRHVAICRYFGEQINDADPEVKKAYCDKMCDVCCKPGAVMRRAIQVTDDVPIASQVVLAPRRVISQASIPSTNQSSTIHKLHLSDAPPLSDSSRIGLGEGPSSEGPDFLSSSPPSNRHHPLRRRAIGLAPVASGRSVVVPPSTSVMSRHDSASTTIATDFDKQEATGPSPARKKRRQGNACASASEDPPLAPIARHHTSIFGRNASAGPSRLRAADEKTRTVSAFDESPLNAGPAQKESITPAEAQRKEKEKAKFMAVRPISPATLGGGPFSYYGNGRSTQTQLRVNGSSASGINRPFRSPLMPDPVPKVIDRISDENRAALLVDAQRRHGLKMITVLEKVFKDDEIGDEVWRCWGRTEAGKKKSRRIKAIAQSLIEELHSRSSSEKDLGKEIDLCVSSFRIFLTQKGADIVLKDELTEWKDDVHGQRLLILERFVRGR